MTPLAISVQRCVLGFFILSMVITYNNNNTLVYAHNFSPNILSTLMSLAHEADIELSLANSSFPSNITLALYHGENAVKLINDAYRVDDEIIDDTDFIKKYNEAQNSKNATIQALVVANIIDQILREYGEAIGIQYDMTNMSNMNMNMTTQSRSNSDPDLDSTFSSSPNSTNVSIHSKLEGVGNNNNTNIINYDNYQSAQKLSERVSLIFSNQLVPISELLNGANRITINMIHETLTHLDNFIDNKASAQDMMMLVHMKIHPALQAGYNLKLKQ
jgi:hypothetical protein